MLVLVVDILAWRQKVPHKGKFNTENRFSLLFCVFAVLISWISVNLIATNFLNWFLCWKFPSKLENKWLKSKLDILLKYMKISKWALYGWYFKGKWLHWLNSQFSWFYWIVHWVLYSNFKELQLYWGQFAFLLFHFHLIYELVEKTRSGNLLFKINLHSIYMTANDI